MSDTMLFGVLRMPYELAMSSELSRRQFHARAQQAADEIERLRSLLAEWRDLGYSSDRDMRTDAALGREPSEIELQYRMARGIVSTLKGST